MEPPREQSSNHEEELSNRRHPPELLEFKRRLEAHGVSVRLPRPGAKWVEREPIDFGESLSDIVIRNRGREP